MVLHGYRGERRDVNRGLSFFELYNRDLTHKIQIVSSQAKVKPGPKSTSSDPHSTLKQVPTDSPLVIRGVLKSREGTKPEKSGHIKIKSKEVELLDVRVLNEAPKHSAPDSPKLRYLQLRVDDQLRRALAFRSEVANVCRDWLQNEQGFLEIETPLLFKSTAEGAREFLVPTRRKGFAYALPQSPQQFKQMLMASGISRYFQLARCFRDEDLRADRQPEFTQVLVDL